MSTPEAATMLPSISPEEFTDDYRATVCKIGQGSDCCRYLTMGLGGWSCVRKTTTAWAIDARVNQMTAQADNCGGCFEHQPAFVLQKEAFGNPVGTLVYHLRMHDYGMASDDTRMTGKQHSSMTLDPSGDYPSFTVADSDFTPLEVPAEAKS